MGEQAMNPDRARTLIYICAIASIAGAQARKRNVPLASLMIPRIVDTFSVIARIRSGIRLLESSRARYLIIGASPARNTHTRDESALRHSP